MVKLLGELLERNTSRQAVLMRVTAGMQLGQVRSHRHPTRRRCFLLQPLGRPTLQEVRIRFEP